MSLTRTRNTRLMIAVLPDEASAFEAYQLLWMSGISPEHLALVGRGYSSPESVGLINPRRIARRAARRGALWLGAGGIGLAIASYFLFRFQWPHVSWSLSLPAAAIGGGAVGALIGGAIGTIYGFFFKGSTSMACWNCLRRGQYLLLLEGTENLTRQGREILDRYTVEHSE